jgi:protein TonB
VVLRVGGDVPEPRKTKHVDPTYPKSARGLVGEVFVEFVIGTNGRVREVKVLRSFPPFDEAVIAAVKQWRYEPTRFRGTSVSILTNAKFAFKDGKVSPVALSKT